MKITFLFSPQWNTEKSSMLYQQVIMYIQHKQSVAGKSLWIQKQVCVSGDSLFR